MYARVALADIEAMRSRRDAHSFSEHLVDLEAITERTRVFRGSVSDAVRWFPQNVNVAAVLNLALDS